MKTRNALLLTVVLTVGGGCAGGSAQEMKGADEFGKASTGGSSPEVSIKDQQFTPNPNEVETGTEITWTNLDTEAHTVTSGTRDAPDGRFDEPLDSVGQLHSYTFTEKGIFEYHCRIHPGMNGRIVVG